ncbi:MAG: hypothetical protein DIU78_011800 [Pseudomonadota bacterium]|nr:MAG: hypothetical protein DIU78_07195 [Pseudomonadota bacterium]
MSARRVVTLAAAAVLAAAPGFAAPTLWERTRDPAAARAERALRRLERIFDGVVQAEGDLQMMQDFRLGTLAIAEMSGAHAFTQPRLRLLLARVLIEADIGREEQAAELARAVLDRLAPGEVWLEAEARVVLAAAAKTPEASLREIARALPLAWHPGTRSSLLRRRADAHMARGDVLASVADYRAAIPATGFAAESALARFGLAVALERSGNLPAALEELRLARLIAPRVHGAELGVLSLPGVFAFRPWDTHYAIALAELGAIPGAADTSAAALSCEKAMAGFQEYLAAAPPSDSWSPAARAHLKALEPTCRTLREQAPRVEDDEPEE